MGGGGKEKRENVWSFHGLRFFPDVGGGDGIQLTKRVKREGYRSKHMASRAHEIKKKIKKKRAGGGEPVFRHTNDGRRKNEGGFPIVSGTQLPSSLPLLPHPSAPEGDQPPPPLLSALPVLGARPCIAKLPRGVNVFPISSMKPFFYTGTAGGGGGREEPRGRRSTEVESPRVGNKKARGGGGGVSIGFYKDANWFACEGSDSPPPPLHLRGSLLRKTTLFDDPRLIRRYDTDFASAYARGLRHLCT